MPGTTRLSCSSPFHKVVTIRPGSAIAMSPGATSGQGGLVDHVALLWMRRVERRPRRRSQALEDGLAAADEREASLPMAMPYPWLSDGDRSGST